MAQIGIQIIVDAQTLAATHAGGTWNNPIHLGGMGKNPSCIYMLTGQASVISGQGTAELTITANVGDEIIWTIAAIGPGISYNAGLYNAQTNSDSISTPQCLFATYTDIKLSSGGSGTEPVFDQIGVSSDEWTSMVSGKNNKTTYTFYFSIVDSNTLVAVGYYKWSAFVEIQN